MARARDADEPWRFSSYFEVDASELDKFGAFDVSLDRDERLLIDPKLLDSSAVPEMEGAYDEIHHYFRGIMRLLRRSRSENDVFWRNAYRRFDFPEFRAAGLGYSARSTQGRGWGAGERERTLRTAAEIIEAGVDDATLFELTGLLETGIGADHVSDMFGTLLGRRLAEFTQRVCNHLGIDLSEQNLARARYGLPSYNDDGKARPIVLVPEDILSRIPLAMDRDEIADVVAANEELRNYVNSQIGTAWLREARRDRNFARRIFRDPRVLRGLIPLYRRANPKRYDFTADAQRHKRLKSAVEAGIGGDILRFQLSDRPRREDVLQVVSAIIEDFKQKVESNRLRDALFIGDKTRPENVLQAVFQLAAQIHCDYNDLDLSPETNAGRGCVDFKFSRGSKRRVLIELKLAANPKLIAGYEKQIAAYEEAERTSCAYYIVLDDGQHNEKIRRLREIAEEDAAENDDSPELIIIDGRRRPSASKL